MHLYRHQVSTIQERPPTNNFDGFVDADMSDVARHFLIAAHVDKHIIITAFFGHDDLRRVIREDTNADPANSAIKYGATLK